MYGLTSRGACPLLKLGPPSFALQQALRASALACSSLTLKALIDASSAPDGITAHELDARVEGVLKVCDQFTSVSALKDFIRSCLRAEAIKSVAARGYKIGYAHGQTNNFLITKRLEGGGLSLKDTQYALDLAARCMAKDSKPTPTPAKTYLTAAADLALNIDEKTEQKEHIAMLLSFYETHKDNGGRGRKSGRGDGGRGRGRGRGGNGGGDGAAFNNLQRSDYIHKMEWIQQNSRRIQDMDKRRQPVGKQKRHGMDYEDH